MVALVLASCTGKSSAPRQLAAPPVTEPPPAPFIAVVDRMEGAISPEAAQRVPVEAGAGVQTYFRRAFLDGPYPRTDYSHALDSWSPGVRESGSKHLDIVANAALGPELDGMRAVHQEARLTVFARDGLAQGAQAAIVLEAVGRHKTAGPVTVRLTGDLTLVPSPFGWVVVGYRLLNEATTPDATVTATATSVVTPAAGSATTK